MEPVSARVRVLARRVAGTADTVDALGGRFAAVDGVDWQGGTATEFRTALRTLTGAAAVLATACDESAGQLAVHADALAAAESAATVLVGGAA